MTAQEPLKFESDMGEFYRMERPDILGPHVAFQYKDKATGVTYQSSGEIRTRLNKPQVKLVSCSFTQPEKGLFHIEELSDPVYATLESRDRNKAEWKIISALSSRLAELDEGVLLEYKKLLAEYVVDTKSAASQ
jgi:hypothetical protein